MDNTTSLGHAPAAKWEFDQNVTQCFDDMLSRSIPQYEVMRGLVHSLAKAYAQRGTWIVDIGCSRGIQLERLCNDLGIANRYCGVEVSKPMAKAAREHLKDWITCGLAEVRELDLRMDFPPLPASVVLSVLTIQFTPIEYRQRIIHNVFDNLLPGGAFIMVEKILADTDGLDETMVRLYYELKHQNGYTTEEIDRKRLALEGVLVPVTAAWNEQLLRRAGFDQVDCFWRWCNFAGWLAIKR